MRLSDGIEALRCADCARSDSAVTDVRPTQRLPLPAEALAGFPGGVPDAGGLTRRRLLAGGAAGFASVYAATHLRWGPVWESIAEAAEAPMGKSLVVIYLNGGNDGLNVIVPTDVGTGDLSYSSYQAKRPNIARLLGPAVGTQAGTLAMPNSGGLSFATPAVSGVGGNGGVYGLDSLYGDGTGGAGSDLAIFPAADYYPPNLSHFESRDYWFAGATEQLPTGWLGRYLDLHGTQNPLQAVSLDSNLSKQIRSSTAPVCAIAGFNDVRFQVPGLDPRVADPTAEIARLAAVPATSTNEALTRSRAMYGLTTQVSGELGSVSQSASTAPYPARSSLSDRLRTAASLLGAGLGTRIVTIDWGSFDTHGAQVAGQDPQLATLSQALAAFKVDLAARGIEQNVVTLVFSEFGRRVESNDSAGTDHGAGGLMMVSGSAVRGGLAGIHPGLGSLDSNGDLRPQTDFRTVYQAILHDWFGVDPAAILPGAAHPGIQRYDGGAALFK